MKVDFDTDVLGTVIYEFGIWKNEVAENDEKIKKRLRRKKLGPFDGTRVSLLRALKDAVRSEVHRGQASPYYIHCKGPHCDVDDFDRARMVIDYAAAFPTISREVLAWFVEFAVITYYCR